MRKIKSKQLIWKYRWCELNASVGKDEMMSAKGIGNQQTLATIKKNKKKTSTIRRNITIISTHLHSDTAQQRLHTIQQI